MIQFVFIVCQVGGYQSIMKSSCRHLAFTSYTAFYKTKRGLELVSLPHFLHDFCRKYGRCIAVTIWYNWPSTIAKVNSCLWRNCSLLGSNLVFSEHILMTSPCRFIYSSEVAIDKKTCSWKIFQISAKYLWGYLFSSKVKIRGMPYPGIYNISEHAV